MSSPFWDEDQHRLYAQIKAGAYDVSTPLYTVTIIMYVNELLLLHSTRVFINRSSTEPKGSASEIHGTRALSNQIEKPELNDICLLPFWRITIYIFVATRHVYWILSASKMHLWSGFSAEPRSGAYRAPPRPLIASGTVCLSLSLPRLP